MSDKTAVILMSGGMDSTVCAAQAIRDGFRPAGLHLRYEQRTAERELQAFKAVCDSLDIQQRLLVETQHFKQIGGSSLTDETIAVTEAELSSDTIPNSYVPFRNANILAMGVAWAETLAAEALYIGAVEEDSSGYPDCRQEFFTAFQAVIDTGTKPETNIKITTPLINLNKAQIVARGIELGAPLQHTWSCYRSSDLACGTCDSCVLRLRGFEQAGHADPLPYANGTSD